MSEINDIIKQAVEACNLELYGIERNHEGLMIYIDSPDNPITIGDCETVLKQINFSTDTSKLHLEVSSKGVYPPLFKPEHFVSAVGEWVKIRTLDKAYKGKLTSFENEEALLQKGEHTFKVAFPSIKSARMVPEQTGD